MSSVAVTSQSDYCVGHWDADSPAKLTLRSLLSIDTVPYGGGAGSPFD